MILIGLLPSLLPWPAVMPRLLEVLLQAWMRRLTVIAKHQPEVNCPPSASVRLQKNHGHRCNCSCRRC